MKALIILTIFFVVWAGFIFWSKDIKPTNLRDCSELQNTELRFVPLRCITNNN